jgi:hypothetical protein
MQFRSPYFLTCLTNSLLMIYLPVWQLWLIAGRIERKTYQRCGLSPDGDMDTTSRTSTASSTDLQRGHRLNHISDDQYNPLPVSGDGEGGVEQFSATSDPSLTYDSSRLPGVAYTDMDILRIAAVLAPIYALSNGLFNYSLIMTSVSSSTIIRYFVLHVKVSVCAPLNAGLPCIHSNLSGTFTFAFSWYIGLEGFACVKMAGIIVCFLGVVCVALSDSNAAGAGTHTVAGDMVALTGAVFYGLYTTTLKYMVRAFCRSCACWHSIVTDIVIPILGS